MAKCLAQGAQMIGAQCCIALLSRLLHGYAGVFPLVGGVGNNTSIASG